jgi:hypothetical protein
MLNTGDNKVMTAPGHPIFYYMRMYLDQSDTWILMMNGPISSDSSRAGVSALTFGQASLRQRVNQSERPTRTNQTAPQTHA